MNTTKVHESIKSLDLRSFMNGFESDNDFNMNHFLSLIDETDENTTLRILSHFNDSLLKISNDFSVDPPKANADEIWKMCHKISSSAQLLGFSGYTHHAKELGILSRDPIVQTEKLTSCLIEFLQSTMELQAKIIANCAYIKHHL